LPNKELFILYDDTDYSYRTVLAGYKVVVARDALMDKYDFQSKTSYREDKIKNKWKLAYHIRNTAYFGHRYGKNIAVRYMAALPFIMRMYAAITFNFVKGHKYSFSDYGLFWRMMRRGLREELGKM
ncbi:MAG: glycosyl transferase, partial [Segatella copri]